MAQSIGLRVGRTHHLVTGVVAIAVLAGSEGSAASPNLEQLRAVPEAKLEKFGPVQAAGRVCGWALVPPTADRPARLVISFWSMANRRFFATFAADLATGKVRRVQEPGFEKDAPRWPSVVAGDGKHVFSCMNGGLAVYDPDADSFKLVRPISRASWLRGLAIGADGAVYMSDYPTGSAARYDLCTGKVEDYGLDYKDLKYNPCNDIIIPSVIRTDDLQKPLGRYYMYYAPHNAPGGICMAYADAPEGPWKEYEANPLIARDWTPHYKVSHVSGPHAIWIEEEKKLFVYYHGENDVTRIASTADGIHFQYEGVAVTTKMFDAISEASYARVFRYTIPGKDNRYIMLLMGNNRGTRRIYLAWSKNGRNWEPRRSPILDPPAGTNQIAQAWYFPCRGRHYLIYHGHLAGSFQTANLYAAEIDPAFERPTHLGLFYDHASASPDDVAQISPCFLTQGHTIYMYTNIGPRLNQKIALAVATVGSPGPQRPDPPSDKR